VPYGLAQIHAMTSAEKLNLNRLLEQQDPDLLDWFLGKSAPKDSSIVDAVRHVLTFCKDREQRTELETMVESTGAARAVSSRSRKR
jgi:succinate dehydrogenase flavin-adding protein (antitoxin of CptAB toxin-antitoxin module)